MPNTAIVVGIRAYPELPPELQGPKNDAQKFYNWVTTQGGVDPANATLIFGADPPGEAAVDGTPTEEVLEHVFDLLEDQALKSPTGRAGDRLYLYLSGHGFGQNLDDASLLMANATQRRPRHHIPGKLWADHFFANGYFREVLLFLDCCRERYSTATLNGPGTTMPPVPPAGARRFYGFAAKYGKLAVERSIDGETRGVFTATLLDALKGGASEDDGRITGQSLKAYLYENMTGFLSAADLANPDVAKQPDLYCDVPEDQFVIARVPPLQYDVAIPLPAGSQGSPLQLIGERNGMKYTRIADGVADVSLQWKQTLPRGTYQLLVNATSLVVTVKGRGVLDVASS
jgi:hypothetical protein